MKQLQYTIKVKFNVPTDRVPDKNIEDIKAELLKLGGIEPAITGQKLIDAE